MHLHLEPVGGMSGDMFIGAILDWRPELGRGLPEILERAGLTDVVDISHDPHQGRALSGSRFVVTERPHHRNTPSPHRTFRHIRSKLRGSRLPEPVTGRGIDIFGRLAAAEGKVHGCAADDVAFHEVGAWDSLADIVIAAYLIETLRATSWSVGPLPLGAGNVRCHHGRIPVPAPATLALLEGFPVIDDGISGERVTPTGAAILAHLEPRFRGPANPMRLVRSGTGFGTAELDDLPNVLRITEFESLDGAAGFEELSVICFEVDDQTPEDLAVGLDNLRRLDGVVDVMSSPVTGKKGRQASHIQVLCPPRREQAVMDECFRQTTTLGLRCSRVLRQTLKRDHLEVDGVGVKTARRPDGMTAKVEIDDLAGRYPTHAQRADAGRRLAAAAIEPEDR